MIQTKDTEMEKALVKISFEKVALYSPLNSKEREASEEPLKNLLCSLWVKRATWTVISPYYRHLEDKMSS